MSLFLDHSAGVPQVSILGLLSFSVYINEVKIPIYADDAVIYVATYVKEKIIFISYSCNRFFTVFYTENSKGQSELWEKGMHDSRSLSGRCYLI